MRSHNATVTLVTGIRPFAVCSLRYDTPFCWQSPNSPENIERTYVTVGFGLAPRPHSKRALLEGGGGEISCVIWS